MKKIALRCCIPAVVFLLLTAARLVQAGEWGMSGRGWDNYSPFSFRGNPATPGVRCVCRPVSCPDVRTSDLPVATVYSATVPASPRVTAAQTTREGTNRPTAIVRHGR